MDTLKKVIEECPYDTSPVDMKECVNDEVDYEKNLFQLKKMRQNLLTNMEVLQKLTTNRKM